MFTGLCAFPLTPFQDDSVDFSAFEKLISNLTQAKVESICAMGSTGLYPYLSQAEFGSVAKQAVTIAGDIPVMAGIGSLRTADVLKNAEIAQRAGVSAVLLAPVSYHPLSEAEVFALYEKVTQALSVPLCVYENPGVTNFVFSDNLYAEVSRLPKVAAIKIPGMPFATEHGSERLAQLRTIVPETVSIGVSGDKFGVAGMLAGCDTWLSVVGGLFPNTVKSLIQQVKSGQGALAEQRSEQLNDLWELFVQAKGGVRVMAAAANILGFTEADNLPHPLSPITGRAREKLENLLIKMQLD